MAKPNSSSAQRANEKHRDVVCRLLSGTACAMALNVVLGGVAYAQLDTIVVTAQKREQSVQEIGGSINAFGEEETRLFANDIGALAGQAPGVESYGNGTFLQSFFIRGIGLNEFAGNFNAPVAIHHDEVYVSKNWQAARPNFDLSRIEVLKGPQGTLFGRNNTGGAVNYFTARPTREFEAYVRGEADLHERYNLQGAVSGPLSDTLSGRFSFYSGFGSGGPQFNLFDGEEHGSPDVHQFRGQLLWEGEATTVRVLAHGGVDKSELVGYKGPGIFNLFGPGFCPEALAGQVSLAPETCAKFNGIAALNGRPELEFEPADVFTINQNHAPRKDDHYYGGYLRIEHDFGNVLLTSISSYDYYERDQQEDSDSAPVASADVDWYNELDQFTQELRLTGNFADGRSNFVLGGFFEHDDLREVDSAELGSDNPFNLPPANAGLPPRLLALFDQQVNSLAFFLNNDFDLTDRITLAMGVRYTRESTTIDAMTNVGLNDVSGREDLPATLLVPGGIDTVNDTTSATNPSNDGITSNKHVDTNVSWKVGLNFEVTEDVLVYTTAQTGFRTGGFSVPFGGSVVEFDREKVLSIESGLKSRFAGDRVQFNIAGFRTRTQNAQVNVDDPLSPLVPITRNIPEIVTWGAEADVQVAPNDYLTANFGVSYLDSEITDSGGAAITTIALAPSTPIQGNSPVNTPEWQLNGRINYFQPLSGTSALAILASADFRWTDERFLEITNQASELAGSYTVVNGRIGLASVDGRWDISVFAKNLFNEKYLTYVNNLPGPGFKIDIFGERRTIGISAGYQF